jgi:sphinganine-1-phosphate aldolase
MSTYPYADRFGVNHALPETGMDHEAIIEQLQTMAREEDARWETGQCSGTMYCGDHDHYAFLNQAFGLFSHANALQRDMCPSATKFEGEILAMTLDLQHASAVADTTPAGMVTSGGTGSILHAVLAYREHAAKSRGITSPNLIAPRTAHPAFDKASHLFGIELHKAPVDEQTTLADVAWIREHIDANTIALVGSACNYGYGTIDPIEDLSELALERGVGLHVDGCLGGFILPFGETLGYAIAPFDYRLPGVTSISADTHKFGYALKGSSTLTFRDKEIRNAQYFCLTDWSGGKYMSPGIEGSRSVGLLASTWAAMVGIGRAGYLEYARKIFEASRAMQHEVVKHPELRILGEPSFLFAFTSDSFDVYHVNDAMAGRGWRFNGLQYPNAIHMATTRPQTGAGVVEKFAEDLDYAVEYAKKHAGELPASGAVYGGIAGGMTQQADEFIKMFMAGMLDEYQSVPEGVADSTR